MEGDVVETKSTELKYKGTSIKVLWNEKEIRLRQLKKSKVRLVLGININNIFIKGENMQLILPIGRTATVELNATDVAGNKTEVENTLFSTTDDTIFMVDDEGKLTPTGIGEAQLKVVTDALIGDGVVELSGDMDVKVVAGMAVTVAVSAVLDPQ